MVEEFAMPSAPPPPTKGKLNGWTHRRKVNRQQQQQRHAPPSKATHLTLLWGKADPAPSIAMEGHMTVTPAPPHAPEFNFNSNPFDSPFPLANRFGGAAGVSPAPTSTPAAEGTARPAGNSGNIFDNRVPAFQPGKSLFGSTTGSAVPGASVPTPQPATTNGGLFSLGSLVPPTMSSFSFEAPSPVPGPFSSLGPTDPYRTGVTFRTPEGYGSGSYCESIFEQHDGDKVPLFDPRVKDLGKDRAGGDTTEGGERQE